MAHSKSAFVNFFVIENLPSSVSVGEVYRSLQLDKFPGKSTIELSLAVDRKGQSLGHAFLTLPRSCTTKLLRINGRSIKGQSVKISLEKERCHLLKGKKWVKTYREKGIIQCKATRPQLISPTEEKQQPPFDLCHQYDMCADLTHHKFSQDLDEVIKNSFYHGISGIVIPGKSRPEAIDLISQYKGNTSSFRLYLSTGIGPSYADKYETEASKIEKECTLDTCTCMGPIGLDYRITRVAKDVQMRAFEEQVKLACKVDKPIYLIEHKAYDDFVRILMNYQEELPNCAIVDFTGTLDELKLYLDMGFYIVITGQIKRQQYLLTAIISEGLETKMIPDDRILLASNCPKFPPVDLVALSNYRPCASDASTDKIPSNYRSEPLCIFTTLELTAKYLGYEEKKDIQDFSKQVMANTKIFLFGRRNEYRQGCEQKVTSKAMKKIPDWFPKILIYQVFVPVLVFSIDRFLKFVGILDHQNDYFYFIFLAIAVLITMFYTKI